MQQGENSIARNRALVILGFVVCNLFVWAMAGYSVLHEKQQFQRLAEVQTQNMAEAVDQNLSNCIEMVDLALKAVLDHLREPSPPVRRRNLEGHLSDFQQGIPFQNGIRVTDQRGLVIYGAPPSLKKPVSYAQYPYFSYLRDHPDAGLQASLPVVGPVSGKLSIILARRYNGPDGRFAGVVSAGIPVQEIQKLFARFDLGVGGRMALRNSELVQLACWPENGRAKNGEATGRLLSRELRDLVGSGVSRATYRFNTPGGDERTVTFHRLGIVPVIVTAGLSGSDYLARWQEDCTETALTVAGFLFLSLASCLAVLRALGRNEQKSAALEKANEHLHELIDEYQIVAEELRQSESKLRIIFDNHIYAIVIFDFDTGEILDVNDAHLSMYGYSRDELCCGMKAWQLTAQPADSMESVRAIGQSGPTFVPLRYHRKKDGTVFPVEIVGGAYQWSGRKVMFGLVHDITERIRALDNLKSYSQRLIVQEEELRKQVSRELHDDIGQALTALGLNLAYVGNNLLEGDGSELRSTLEDSRQLTKEISRTVRNLMVELRPSQLEDYGLAAALHSYAVQYGQRTGLDVELAIDPEFPRLSPAQEIALFRITQEALNNAAKYSAASRVTVALERSDKALQLSISDDGQGFLPEEATPQQDGSGWGLTIMRERAELAGGSLRIASRPGEGTTVVIQVAGSSLAASG